MCLHRVWPWRFTLRCVSGHWWRWPPSSEPLRGCRWWWPIFLCLHLGGGWKPQPPVRPKPAADSPVSLPAADSLVPSSAAAPSTDSSPPAALITGLPAAAVSPVASPPTAMTSTVVSSPSLGVGDRGCYETIFCLSCVFLYLPAFL